MIEIFQEINNSKKKKYFFAILCIGLILRILTLFYFGFGLSNQDLYEYGQIANNIIAGNGFSRYGIEPTCVMAPIYPYFLASFYFLFGETNTSYSIIQIFQVIIGLFTILPLFYISKKIFSENIALISIFIFAIFPDFLYSPYALHPLTFSTFAVVFILYLFYKFIENYSFKAATILGLTAGFSLLLEPAIISIIILLLFFGLFDLNNIFPNSKKIILKNRAIRISTLLALIILIISPWIIRNYYVTDGHFVFIKHSGYNLFRGNNEHFTDFKSPDPYSNNQLKSINKLKEYEREKIYKDYALNYMKNNLGTTIENIIVKIYQFWWFPIITPQQSPLLRKILYLPLLLIAFIGIYSLRKRLVILNFVLIPILGFNILYAITFVLPRYRIAVQPLIFILSAVGISYLYDLLKKKSIIYQ